MLQIRTAVVTFGGGWSDSVILSSILGGWGQESRNGKYGRYGRYGEYGSYGEYGKYGGAPDVWAL